MSYQDDLRNLRDKHGELSDGLSQCTNLDRALRYLASNPMFALSRMDVVAQDEFTHDVLIPFAEGPKYLILGST